MININDKASSANVSKFLVQWLKLIVTISAFAYIIVVIFSIPRNQYIEWNNSLEFSFNSALVFIAVLILAYVNWFLESEKWRNLALYLQPINRKSAFKAILFGVALGMITPKRLGEYAGRVFVLKKNNRIKGLLLNSLASLTQLSITLVFGITSLIFSLAFYKTESELFSYNNTIIIAFAIFVALSVFLTIVFFKPIVTLISQKIKSDKWKKYLQAFSLIKTRTIYILFLYSLLRYLVFVFQFYLLLIVFGFEITFIKTLILQSIIYLIMTIIPVSALSESGVKSSVSLIVFNSFPILSGNYYEAALISASLLLWVYNLVIPALGGVIISMVEGVRLKKLIKND
jgi:uncharacterized membrane protein YbhN (UPF0104 family)